jgi:hypothetical protein
MGLRPTHADEKSLFPVLLSVPNRIVIPRACDFFYSAHLTGCFSPPTKASS